MDCLRQVLKHYTAYVGMIGSKRRVKSVMEQMLNEGYPKEKLNKVKAPISLEIGAITPEEIAISIISQVISYRRLGDITNDITRPTKTNWPEFDHEVLMELCKEDNSPKAIITIVSTKGSVPRNVGYQIQSIDMRGTIAEDEGMVCGGIMDVIIESF
ncbi:XdhC/CoxI family protein [Clostridium estertheticum]|uniref:XdhC/CoxI family protein n=1 Tax=Clostridium estertheticum TaxID=238834 RepID=UPI0021E26FB2|nr:XdhC/CoxI family protein [Clostridium estertheticum]